jgi:hypothetical protein
VSLTLTFRALALKYRFAGVAREAGTLTFDRVESGFPVAAELMEMAADATQAAAHLQGLPSAEALKDAMVRHILSERTAPTKLHYAMSQRLYFEELAKGGLFFARNDAEAVWLGTTGEGRGERRKYLLRWSVYEASENIPVLYLMTVEDSGRGGGAAQGPEPLAAGAAAPRGAVGGGADASDHRAGVRCGFRRPAPQAAAALPHRAHAFAGVHRPAGADPRGADGGQGAGGRGLGAGVGRGGPSQRAGGGGAGTAGSRAPRREVFALAEPKERGWSEMTRSLVLPGRVYQAMAEPRPAGVPGDAQVRCGGGRQDDEPAMRVRE